MPGYRVRIAGSALNACERPDHATCPFWKHGRNRHEVIYVLIGDDILLFGESIARSAGHNRVARGVCQVPEGRQIFGPMSVEDNVLLGAYRHRDALMHQRMEDADALFSLLKEKRKLMAGTLSGGQQQMLAIARALMGKPKILLLDELSLGLAPLLVAEIFRVISRLRSKPGFPSRKPNCFRPGIAANQSNIRLRE